MPPTNGRCGADAASFHWEVHDRDGTLFVYGKKDRVAPLVYVQARHDATGVVVAQYTYTFPVPGYYLGRPRPPVFVFSDRNRLAQDARAVRAASPAPNYLILYSDSADADAVKASRQRVARRTRV